ncbi:MAG: alpha/beta hydrolase, partial [Sphingobacteriales bacterium]
FLVAAPDYIGYGASKNQPHPYQHAPSLATAGADMLRAAKEWALQHKIRLNGQLFLTGYSEGGFATMALHQKLETEMAGEFTVTASAPGAGAYHTSAFAKHVLSSDKPLSFINTYLWVLDTYNREYKLNKPFSYYLNEPYATQFRNGNRNISNAVIPKKLFRDSFRKAVQTGTDKGFMNALRDNDIYDWKPNAPVALFHGTNDDYVPFFNSKDAYHAMRARGATNVKLYPIKGGDHFSSVPQYSAGLILFFTNFIKSANDR